MTSETVIELNNGDCLEMMKDIPDKSVDLFICDLPYAETNCKWDVAIDMEQFWSEFRRLRASKRTACIHFCSTKFGYTLIKSWEKGYKMDMVWKKRNKTGGLQSRHRPMRNHEMVYFFYEQAPKYNRDKYHKRIQAKKEHKIEKEDITMGKTSKHRKSEICFEPPNPASVVEEEDKWIKEVGKNGHGWDKHKPEYGSNFEPVNPVSVLEEKEPPNPASVVEEKAQEQEGRKKYKNTTMGDIYLKKAHGAVFEPPNPASVVEEKDEFGWDKSVVKEMGNKVGKIGANFDPPNPASVLEADDETLYNKIQWVGAVVKTIKRILKQILDLHRDNQHQ